MKAVHYQWPMVIEAAYSALHDKNGDQKAGRQEKRHGVNRSSGDGGGKRERMGVGILT